MANTGFDWTEILPEPERSKVRAERRGTLEEFLDSFPTKEEVEQAGREGREAFFEARAQVDKARIADLTAELRKLQDIIDNQADRILDVEAAAKRNETCFLVVHDLVVAAREDLRLKVENAPAELVQAVNMALYAIRNRAA